MKKFKIRNRIKRKYVKKHEAQASFPLSNTLAWGILPMILMTIAFFATLLINHPPTETVPDISYQVTIPNFWDALTRSLNNLINNFPAIHLEWNLHVPSFNLQPLTKTLNYNANAVDVTLSHFFVLLGSFFHAITTAIGENSMFTARIIGSFITHTLGLVIAVFWEIGKSITAWWNAFVYFIATPFRITGHFLLQLKPVYTFIGTSFQHSFNDLIINFNGIVKDTAPTPQPSH